MECYERASRCSGMTNHNAVTAARPVTKGLRDGDAEVGCAVARRSISAMVFVCGNIMPTRMSHTSHPASLLEGCLKIIRLSARSGLALPAGFSSLVEFPESPESRRKHAGFDPRL